MNTVAKILKKVSTGGSPEYSLPEYKPMAKAPRFQLQREASLPRIEVDRPKPQVERCNSAPQLRGCSPAPPAPTHSYGTLEEEERRRDRSQKLLTNTKRVRGLRSFLWIKPQASSPRDSFLAQLLPCLTANLSSLSVGLTLGYTTVSVPWAGQESPHLPPLSPLSPSNSTSPLPLPHSPALGSWIASSLWLGAILGPLLSRRLSPLLGPRLSLLALTLPDTVAWILLSCSHSFPVLTLARTLSGLAMGGYLPTLYSLVSSLSQPHHLPLLSLLPLPTLGLGTLLAYTLSLLLPPHSVAILSASVPLILSLSLLSIPDSPHWLVSRDKDQAALSSLERLRGGDTASSISELVQIQQQVRSQEAAPDFLEGVQTIFRKHMDTFLAVNGLIFIMVFSGKFTIDFYAIQLMEKAGVGHHSEHLSAAIIAFFYVIGCILFIGLVPRFPRNTLYLLSSMVCGVSLTMFGLSVYQATYYHYTGAILPILALSVFMLASPLGLTSVPLTMMADSFPPELSSLAGTLSLSLTFLQLLVSSTLFLILQTALGLHGVLWLQACVCFLASLLGLHLLPPHTEATMDTLHTADKFAGLRSRKTQAWVSPLPCTGVQAI